VTTEADFLIALGQTLSAAGLYGDEHPAFRSAADGAFVSLEALVGESSLVQYSFLEGEVIFANRRLRELRDWHWAGSLAEAGAERIEITIRVDREEFDLFLNALIRILEPTDADAEDRARVELPHMRIGSIAVDEAKRLTEAEEADPSGPEMDEETQAVDHLFGQAENRGLVSLAVARAVVQSLSVVLQYGRPLMELLVPVRHHDEYTTVHSLNVSVLSMSLAESLGTSPDDVRDIGEAALLHDLGKAHTPIEVLQKPGKLSPDEWEIIKRHPEEGARIIHRSGGSMEFAAVVAYEHHLTWQGGGYPNLRFPRRPHPVSQMVQICDIFDALRTERPFRGPWPIERIIGYFGEISGTDLNPDVLNAFNSLLSHQKAPDPSEEENGRGEIGDDAPRAASPEGTVALERDTEEGDATSDDRTAEKTGQTER
jgi:putative nucleotidyltransferase with HDIG domain